MLPTASKDGHEARATARSSDRAKDSETTERIQTMILESVRNEVKQRTARLRSVLRIVETKEFAEAFALATLAQKAEIAGILTPRALRVWLARVTKRPLSQLSYRALRELAKQNHIQNYCRVEKDDLIKQLEAKGVKPNAGQLEQSGDAHQGDALLPAGSQGARTTDDDASHRPGEPAGRDSVIKVQ